MKLAGVDETGCRGHLHAATRRDQVASAAQHLPIRRHATGAVELIAGKAQRVHKQSECGQRERARQDEADPELVRMCGIHANLRSYASWNPWASGSRSSTKIVL